MKLNRVDNIMLDSALAKMTPAEMSTPGARFFIRETYDVNRDQSFFVVRLGPGSKYSSQIVLHLRYPVDEYPLKAAMLRGMRDFSNVIAERHRNHRENR